ncbi:ATPase, T2SS/T4P/T4SS family [Paenibacillus polymyxa]|uniref:ATPase, T2SS/T4P/T4SS family n=1 Tax=Paenibacillus polymyxa TaxID=1406 RepID=UPI002AB4D868|nr:ATPase, T2SS/T4P/T4SS family [Paenibacillus polymyxa]MDY7989819.1 ATPase, T2SS/T4P/T4SS family [Paenibacillus polymyxa]MDY8116822.1 ATPase, T2SS/T4P/T4SS family [Paenibacillus polymyxa]
MIGIINPAEYVQYQRPDLKMPSARSKTDNENLKGLLERTQQYLITHYNDEFVKAIIDEQSRKRVKYHILDYIRDQRDFKFSMDISEVINYIQTEITEMGVLQPALDDPEISSIEINGPDEVIVERNGFPEHMTEIRFQDNEHIYRTIDKMLMPIGKSLTANEPVIDANYRGFRINVIMDVTRGGVSTRSPIISIRKFPPDVFSDEQCIAYGNISPDISKFLQGVLPYGVSSIVAGGTNSGKTTQLIRLPKYYDPLTRFFCIEDSEEMLLKGKTTYLNYPNIASVIVKEHEDERKSYFIPKLVKTSLRQNPDVILIGEVRDKYAAQQALVAANTGHIVHLTIHSNGLVEAAVRFLQLSGNDPMAASQIAMSFDLILFQKYEASTGKRVVFEIGELLGFEGGKPLIHSIFKYDPTSRVFHQVGKLRKLKSKLVTEGAPDDVISRWCEE